MRKSKKRRARRFAVKEIVENFQSETDLLGSYTGLPDGRDKTPVQDADDL